MPKANWYVSSLQKSPVPTLIGTAVVGFGVWLIGRRLFRPPRPPRIPTYQLPDGGAGLPASWSPNPLAQELYDTMKGLSFFPNYKEAAWRKLSELPTNDMVVAVYNSFNSIPGTGEAGSLTTWIRDETGAVLGMGSYKNAALNRLIQSGLA